jgi:NADH-quinone oxidoreductase subunit H
VTLYLFLWHAFVGIFAAMLLLNLTPILIWLERKVCAWIQHRAGPNRVGPFGLLQPLADAVKLLTKEEIIPASAERALYYLAPMLAFVPAALAFTVIPMANSYVGDDGTIYRFQVANLNVGIIFVLAITSIGVYGLAFAGWTANSKYPLLAGLRSSAQLVSYEIAMGLAIISVLMTAESVDMNEIVLKQQTVWNVFRQPLAALIFLAAAFAENNRLPFDLPECEPELVGGYHTEYSGMKFATFFLGEYVAMITMSAVMVTLFFGGWTLPGIDLASHHGVLGVVISLSIFLAKLVAMLWFYIQVRWTLPRFRYDQLMKLGWKTLIPLGLANVLLTGAIGVL